MDRQEVSGQDLIGWLEEMGLAQTPIEKRGADATLPLIAGALDGHTAEFRSYAQQGITLLGRLQAGRGRTLRVCRRPAGPLPGGDAAYNAFLDAVDAFVERHEMRLVIEPAARQVRPDPPGVAVPVRQLDTGNAGPSSVISLDRPMTAAGSTCRYRVPRHSPGIKEVFAQVSGIDFLGLPWLSKMTSSFLSGVGDDADRLADPIQAATRALP